jgi:hypothetical protein
MTLSIKVPYAECLYAECLYAECLYAECLYAECLYAECLFAEGRVVTASEQWSKDDIRSEE